MLETFRTEAELSAVLHVDALEVFVVRFWTHEPGTGGVAGHCLEHLHLGLLGVGTDDRLTVVTALQSVAAACTVGDKSELGDTVKQSGE